MPKNTKNDISNIIDINCYKYCNFVSLYKRLIEA